MDFREFSDVERMESFADSMFTALRKNKIGNLIIDLRKNGGGNSSVGDRLLRYITPEPYMQMDKALVKITPLTKKLMKAPDIVPTFMFWEATPDQYIVPRTADEGHYDGNVYLLTSNKTFSSAGSFAWAFKECGMGTVIGEETGWHERLLRRCAHIPYAGIPPAVFRVIQTFLAIPRRRK